MTNSPYRAPESEINRSDTDSPSSPLEDDKTNHMSLLHLLWQVPLSYILGMITFALIEIPIGTMPDAKVRTTLTFFLCIFGGVAAMLYLWLLRKRQSGVYLIIISSAVAAAGILQYQANGMKAIPALPLLGSGSLFLSVIIVTVDKIRTSPNQSVKGS